MQLGQIGALDLARDAPGGMIVIDVRGRVAGVQHIESNILAGDQVGGVGFAQNLLEELQRIFTIYSLEGFSRRFKGECEPLDHHVPHRAVRLLL